MKANTGYWFLRVSMGAVMALHGLAKLAGGADVLRYVGGMVPHMPEDPTVRLILGGLAATFELVGGIGVILGCKVRWAAAMLVAVLAAAFTAHIGNVKDFSSLMLNTWPLELALVFVAIAIIGNASDGAKADSAKK
jgi:uncharacterized membrane protein YphA (DoxX/SURF4 family)